CYFGQHQFAILLQVICRLLLAILRIICWLIFWHNIGVYFIRKSWNINQQNGPPFGGPFAQEKLYFTDNSHNNRSSARPFYHIAGKDATHLVTQIMQTAVRKPFWGANSHHFFFHLTDNMLIFFLKYESLRIDFRAG